MICGLLFSVVTFAQAQQGGGDRKPATPEERAQRSADQLSKKLSLSDDQKAKVTAIYLEQAAAMKKVRDEANGDREVMMAKMKAANEANDVKINAVLTEDQKKAYSEWKAERAESMKKRMGKKGPEGGSKR